MPDRALLTSRRKSNNFRAHVRNGRVGFCTPLISRRSNRAIKRGFSMAGRLGATSVAPFLETVVQILFVPAAKRDLHLRCLVNKPNSRRFAK